MRRLTLSTATATNAYASWDRRLAEEPTVRTLGRLGADLADRGAGDEDLAAAAVSAIWPHRGKPWPNTFDPAHGPFVAVALGARLLFLGANTTLAAYTSAAHQEYPFWRGTTVLAAAGALTHTDTSDQLCGLALDHHPVYVELALVALDRYTHRPSAAAAQETLAGSYTRSAPEQAEGWYYLARARHGLGDLDGALVAIDRALDTICSDPDMSEAERLWAETAYSTQRHRTVLAHQLTR